MADSDLRPSFVRISSLNMQATHRSRHAWLVPTPCPAIWRKSEFLTLRQRQVRQKSELYIIYNYSNITSCVCGDARYDIKNIFSIHRSFSITSLAPSSAPASIRLFHLPRLFSQDAKSATFPIVLSDGRCSHVDHLLRGAWKRCFPRYRMHPRHAERIRANDSVRTSRAETPSGL